MSDVDLKTTGCYAAAPPDPQAKAIYRADAMWRQEHAEMLEPQEVLDFARHVTESVWWTSTANDNVVPRFEFVDDTRASATSSWTDGCITLPPWARCRQVVVHELAHQLVGEWDPATMYPRVPHGYIYASSYIALFACAVSARSAYELYRLMTREGVKFGFEEPTPKTDQRGFGIRTMHEGKLVHARHYADIRSARDFFLGEDGFLAHLVDNTVHRLESELNAPIRRAAREAYQDQRRMAASCMYHCLPPEPYRPPPKIEARRPVPFSRHRDLWLRITGRMYED